MQTMLLLEYFGIYGGDDGLFLKAQRMHRDLVEAMRMLQMSHDGRSSSLFQDSDDDPQDDYEGDLNQLMDDMNDATTTEASWQSFITLESKKRNIYCLYLLDSQLSILCNVRPQLSSLEIKHDLPCCEQLWLAKSATDWASARRQQFNSWNDHEDRGYEHSEQPHQGFFFETMQTLLHSDRSRRKPRKLGLLWASPFAAIILVTQLHVGSRFHRG